ncbi:hypothetical protein DW322_14585 [Rhodococcus rhodnii]|uniref:HTH iclR-type domain-containing protein n=1 Tax=Rhodococcus rhodnii TaxID=38312 RepID=A0A6P2CLK6_9NOCA|nr:hypothetical protein DW322_14585 [Rhodococcus rhodnii]
MVTAHPETITADLPPRPERDIDLFRLAVTTLRAALPPGWTVASGKARSLADAPERLTVTAPTGEVASFSVVAARGVLAGDVARIAETVADGDNGLVCARYLSDPVRRHLDSRGLSYADATGNVSLCAPRPAIWVRDRGADADPWRGPGRPPAQLTGDPAARVVRALADNSGQPSVPQVVTLSGASTGATYRVVETLAERDLLDRIPRGPITRVRWQAMLRAWSADASFSGCQRQGFRAPDGVAEVLCRLAALDEHVYSVTGSAAARLVTDYAAVSALDLYADDVRALATELGLRPLVSPADPAADVVVATPRSPVVFDRLTRRDDVRYAPPAQAFADLLGCGGAKAEEAEHLLQWMTRNEAAWRTPMS